MSINNFETTLKKVYQNQAQNGIGTLSEKTLHAFIKHFIEPNETYHEIKLENYVVDIFDGHKITEIQTRQFFKLIPKLDKLLDTYPITIVYPIPYIKHLSWIDLETGEVSKPRKSPKKGHPVDSVTELYALRNYLNHPNLTIHLLFFNLLETRYLNGWSFDKKKGSHRADRRPSEYIKSVILNAKDDYKILLPNTLESTITTQTLKKDLNISPKKATLCINVLNTMNCIEYVGKDGRYKKYRTL